MTTLAQPLHPFELAIDPLFKVASTLVTGLKKIAPKYLFAFLKEQATFLCVEGVPSSKQAQTLEGDKNVLGEFCNACERGNLGGPQIPMRGGALFQRVTSFLDQFKK